MMPLVSLGVAKRPEEARALWSALLAVTVTLDDVGLPIPQSPDAPELPGDVPEAPWLAAAIHAGLGLWAAVHPWIGQFERAIAWHWLET